MHFAVPHIRILTDLLPLHTNKLNRWSWDAEAPLPDEVVAQIRTVILELQEWQGRKFVVNLPSKTVYTDASETGYGAAISDPTDDIDEKVCTIGKALNLLCASWAARNLR